MPFYYVPPYLPFAGGSDSQPPSRRKSSSRPLVERASCCVRGLPSPPSPSCIYDMYLSLRYVRRFRRRCVDNRSAAPPIPNETLEHPYHMSIQRYKARQYIANHYQDDHQNGCQDVLLELAKSEFNRVQLLHQRELNEILSWWTNTRLAQDLSFVRDQPLKWYLWPLTVVPHPHLSMCRIELTKAIAFIYIIDDIFDVHGTLEELSLFTQAINKWDLSSIDVLPNYMQVCYNALYKITNEIADITLKEYGWNPINTLSKSWAKLCNAFLQEAKWFTSGQVPNKDEYLRNAVISSGVFIVIVHLFFLMGNGLTKENVEHIEEDPSFISYTGTILRLWDDLGSAKLPSSPSKVKNGSWSLNYMSQMSLLTLTNEASGYNTQ
ncbi:hypothetical protein J5N97_025491 [Dioscorea zingiberensis]|uniref:Terpene synthase metal-binding domain-containing protein n=1 Tax=Dioscorea zingiberensis TaxID=325984 RepID=A0A9D5C8T5_9LILI|nr:hypothetical protein J5N97_025491 [Dioscorea zingiberensis]